MYSSIVHSEFATINNFPFNVSHCRSISKNGGGSKFSFDSSDNGVFALPTLLIGSGMSSIFHESNPVEVLDYNVNLWLVEKRLQSSANRNTMDTCTAIAGC